MRSALFLITTALLAAPAAAADLPAVVVQLKPIGPQIEDIRAGAKMLGGEAALKQLDAQMKEILGEKGLSGLDLTRPIVGYAVISEDVEAAEKTPFVFAVPITSEEAFLDLIFRANKSERKAEPVPGKKGLYKLPATRPLNPDQPVPPADGSELSVMRIVGNNAYLTQEAHGSALDPDKLVPAEKLVLPGETAHVTFKVYFDRFPESVRKKFSEQIDKALQEIRNAPLPMENVKNRELAEKAEAMVREMFTRLVTKAKEAREGTVRIVFDAKTGEAGIEFAVTPRPGTSLAADISSQKPNMNRFAGLVGSQTAAGITASGPLFGQDGRDMLAMLVESAAKEGLAGDDVPEEVRPLLKEAFAGTVRTLKAGPVDEVIVLNGPDPKGTFTALGAISFEDPSAIEKEIRKLVKETAPPEVQELVTFDTAKVGDVGIHTVKVPPGQLPPEVQKVFGESAMAAIAFAPKGIYVAFGPDPVAAIKDALAQKPREARVVDLAVNPSRIAALIRGTAGDDVANNFVKVIGEKDELLSVFFVTIEGGTELKARVGMNIKLLGGAVTQTVTSGPGEEK